jgi:hypothetical protein
MRTTTLAGVVAVALAFTRAVSPAAQSDAPYGTDKISILGTALNFSNTGTGANQTIRINIDRWSTPSQRQHLITTFLEKGGQNALLKALDKQPVFGRFNFPGYFGPDPNHTMRLGTDIRYARNFAGEDGGRRIVIITSRIIGFREEVNQPRTTDYPFTLFEMRFGADGKGQGKLAYATKITFDKKKNNVELENYASEPVRLNNLELEVRK